MRTGIFFFTVLLAAGCSPANDSGSDAGTTDTPDLAPSPPPSYCPAPVVGDLQDVAVGTTPAAPYFVAHPTNPDAKTSTVIFLPGGGGDRDTSNFIYAAYLQTGNKAGDYRLIVPYADDGDFTDEGERTTMIVDEVLTCFGGDPAHVHLAGTSNGGVAAYEQMLAHSDRFVTLLGAPGVFARSVTDDELKMALTGKAVFNGVGALDMQWMPEVKMDDMRLQSLGLTSMYVEFPGQTHIVNSKFDPSVFFDFWSQH